MTFYLLIINQIMEKISFTKVCLVAALFATALVSCEKNNDTPKDEPVILEGGELSGRYTADITLKKGDYDLTGSLQIVAPAVLTIEPGTRITAVDNGEINYILIEQGAKIIAEGSAQEPIVFTAQKKQAGAWGGVHICGKAHSNAGSDNTSEIGNANYGGSSETDNSGIIKYVVIEYSGYALDSEHEANGLTLYGVGSGTEISHLQVKDGSDDGIEFFGGSVCIDHCIVENCTDDSFDWTEGWNGTAEYIIAYQDVVCDCLMECDNNGDNNDALPVSHPTIKNATFIGMNSDGKDMGLRFRAGTYVNLSNALIAGKDKSIQLETMQTVNSFNDGKSSIASTIISSELLNKEGEGYSNDDFKTGSGNVSGYDFSDVFVDKYVGKVGECGAVDSSDNWAEGWTR